MNESICNFLPDKVRGRIRTVHFVYETEIQKLKQPFFHAIHYIYLVTSGSAEISFGEARYTVKRGSLFFFFPAVFYHITPSEDFRYMYISFEGEGVAPLLEDLGIDVFTPARHDFASLVDLWFLSLTRVNSQNANILSEGVLLYTLSFFAEGMEKSRFQSTDALCKMLVDYVEAHYTEPDLSLGKIAKDFSYTEKYLSVLFKKHMSIGFSKYLSDLRLRHAQALLSENGATVSSVAAASGYRDALYFSKCFKAKNHISPSEFLANRERKRMNVVEDFTSDLPSK